MGLDLQYYRTNFFPRLCWLPPDLSDPAVEAQAKARVEETRRSPPYPVPVQYGIPSGIPPYA
jgi:hypothetical protein